MKIKVLILLLLFFSNLNAQTNFDTAKLKNNSIDVENRFILPVYKNQIVDAEKFFSENEIQLLHKSIDSIFRSIKL